MKNRILELDAFRGIAALAVVVFHLTLILGHEQLLTGLNIGCMGVDMFFIISGFVIFMSIQNAPNWKTFIRGRFYRLYPTYWFCVTITAILVFLKTGSLFFIAKSYEWTNSLFTKYLANMTMLQYFIRLDDLDSSYWTLGIELMFYAFICFLLIINIIKYIEIIGLVMVIFSLSFSLDLVAQNYIMHKVLILVPLLKYFSLFYAGIILYKMKFDKINSYRISLFALTLFVQCMLFTKYYHNNQSLSLLIYSTTLSIIYVLFILFLFGKLHFIVSSVTQWLGKISYSLYAIHQYFGAVIVMPLLLNYFHINFWLAVMTSIVIVLILAMLINQFVERPALKYLKTGKASSTIRN